MRFLDFLYFRLTTSLSGFMWYKFCFGTAVRSGDIEVVIMQGKASTLMHINTDTVTKQNMQ